MNFRIKQQLHMCNSSIAHKRHHNEVIGLSVGILLFLPEITEFSSQFNMLSRETFVHLPPRHIFLRGDALASFRFNCDNKAQFY